MTDPTATVSIKKMKANESVFPSNDFDVTPSAPHHSTEDGATRSRSHSPISIKTLIVPIKNDYLTV